MAYVDGFLLPVPKKNLEAYLKVARRAGKVFREYGALRYVECVEDDANSFGFPFAKRVKPKPGEVIVFSFIVHKSRAQRDRTNAKAMKDPRLMADMENLPFDPKRMSMSGFSSLVDL